MTTQLFTIQVAASDQKGATSALESAGFKVRLDLDYPTSPGKTTLELEISYPLVGSDDPEVSQQAMALRDSALTDAGIEFQHLGSGVSADISLSTYVVRKRNDPADDTQVKIFAADWTQFLSIWALRFGDFDEEEFEVTVSGGLAANDPLR